MNSPVTPEAIPVCFPASSLSMNSRDTPSASEGIMLPFLAGPLGAAEVVVKLAWDANNMARIP
eukprot:CAMPEP_0178447334 /NCGR_PEP_ID=MMETSP0689_2-20121128/41329_1 /TAXON_ID=160604 /ORGANISM="Amphidinium massartii, Strain CS-259" /LENGTH=62 /DNA_ID=CAMNT_0020072313 /DNA_START=91 /DNA_END=275 /DNA_ORIENTATION=+